MKAESNPLSSPSAGPCSLQMQAMIEGYLPDVLPYSLICDIRIYPKFLPSRSHWQETLDNVWQRLGLGPLATGSDSDHCNLPDAPVYWSQQYLGPPEKGQSGCTATDLNSLRL